MAHSIKDQVAVIGVGCIKFGDNFDQGYEEMAVEAAFAAFHDAKITPDEIEAAWLGTYSPAQGHGKSAVSLGDALRLYNKPISRVENFCATGTDAFRHAVLAVASGVYDTALVLGVEKYKDRPGRGLAREGVQHEVGRPALMKASPQRVGPGPQLDPDGLSDLRYEHDRTCR